VLWHVRSCDPTCWDSFLTTLLLVLDDVTNCDQLNDLIGRRGSFGEGSRIVVTTRDKQVLKNVHADGIYEVKEMHFQESPRLFCLKAFKQNYPIEDYAGFTEKILNYAKGVPLALKVLGSSLYGRTKEIWKSQLKKLEKPAKNDIFKVLKLSYEGLDEEEMDIFLDIACFYRGHSENVVAQTLDSCGFSAHIGMEILKDRCLISISEGRIMMHNLIQGMGHEIVRQQCVNDPGKHSRLWKHDDIYKVLYKNKLYSFVQISCTYFLADYIGHVTTFFSFLFVSNSLHILLGDGCNPMYIPEHMLDRKGSITS